MTLLRSVMSRLSWCVIVGMILSAEAGCNRAGDEPVAPHSMQLTIEGTSGSELARSETCDGAGVSPRLSWTAPPSGTRSLALVVTDRDSRFGYNFVHWVLYDLPTATHTLPEGEQAAAGVMQGLNDDGKPGYYPPCPPHGSPHRYDFMLYAVDRRLDISAASKKQLLDAIRGHVLGEAETVVHYHR